MDNDTAQWLADYTEQLKQLYGDPKDMPSINDIYPNTSSNLKAEDIPGPVKVTIESWEVVEFDSHDGKKQPKIVLSFKGKEKRLVCNRTNATRIADYYGEDPEGWIGKEITLYPTKVDFGGEQVPAIRVKEMAADADPDDDIPF